MIKINAVKRGNEFKVSIRGHANPFKDKDGVEDKEYGLICASASILAWTISQNAIHLYDTKILKSKPIINMASGNTQIKIVAKKEFEDVTLTILSAIFTGFELLANSFPEQVEFTKFGKTIQ